MPISKLPRLPGPRVLDAACAALLALAVLVPGQAAGQASLPDSVYRRSTDRSDRPDGLPNESGEPGGADRSAGGAEQGGQAERIVAASLAGLARAESISARVRQKVRVGNRVLVGSGRYVQSGLGEDQRFRFESSMKADTETFEVIEVTDGIFFWTYRRLGAEPAQVERIDIRRIRERLQKLRPGERGATSAYLGGIQRSLSLVREWFRFVSVDSAEVDGLPVWNIEGRWNVESIAALLPERAEAIRKQAGISPAELPDGMPCSVRVAISKRELFPFRIEWFAIPGRRPVADGQPVPVAVHELYDVRIGEPVDAAAFVYKPATEGLIDLTETAVKHLAPLRP